MIERDEILRRLDRFTDIQHELESILQTLVLNDSTIIDALAQMLGAIQRMNARAEQTQAGVEKSQNRLAADVRALTQTLTESRPAPLGERAIIATRDPYLTENPEVWLLQYLYAFLDDTTAVDVGAHDGEVSERLLQSGYTVHAFEPFPASFAALRDRLGGRARFSSSPLAIGREDGESLLHLARDRTGARDPSLFHSLVEHPLVAPLEFADSVPVRVRSLESLRRSGEIPGRIGLLKIDAEGLDLDVILGMGPGDIPVVMAEFWDADHAFGRSGHLRLEPTVEAIRARGYAWHVVIYHLDQEGTIGWYVNRVDTVPKSWGNVVFFRDRALFMKAVEWCVSALPGPVQS
jgi:FkbM family methyltransferase